LAIHCVSRSSFWRPAAPRTFGETVPAARRAAGNLGGLISKS
jgi:hypothetical protein